VPRPFRVRIEGDSAAVAAWLRKHDYPHRWSAETLGTHAIKAGLWDGGTLAGYVWAVWSQDGTTLLFHGCIAPAYRGRWISPELIQDLKKLASFLGADVVMANIPADTARKYGRLLGRYGFTVQENPPLIHSFIGERHGRQDHPEAEEAED
jgi:GNAT superfamily N-acetyltransferase